MPSAQDAPNPGTQWRIWDLHVHTPASIVSEYGGDTDEVWERFIDELERLPADLRVIGINDYWFLDGYRRVLAEKHSGRLTNLDAIFPVIEMRLDQFGGTAGDLSRVNLHVILDPKLDPDVIQAQFLSSLAPKVRLSADAAALDWQGLITYDALIDLGQKIKASVPENRRGDYGSDLQEGFNNLNVSLTAVEDALASTFLKGRALIGIGKTEWADIKWNDQSIAAKKTVVNTAALLFTAYEDAGAWERDVAKLRDDLVNHNLLDCSDAHSFSDSKSSMRLGACQTWMNTTPTFAGLAYALEEFDRRVFVGLEPPALGRIRSNPERFISSIEVRSDRTDRTLFDYDLPLNPGFVAVVGNKGQGKSALLDCVALAGNSSRIREFAFLNPKRFLSSASRRTASDYYTEVTWETGGKRRSPLDGDHDRSAPVYVEYLPQAFVERVCSADPATGDADEFEKELRAILFTHISDEDRLGERTFDALLNSKTRSSLDQIERLRDGLREAIESYVAITTFRAENVLQDVEGRLALKTKEVATAQAALKGEETALGEIDSASSESAHLAALKSRSDEIEQERDRLLELRIDSEQKQAQLQQSLSAMAAVLARAESLRSDASDINFDAGKLTGDAFTLVSVEIDHASHSGWREQIESDLTAERARHAGVEAQVTSHEEERRENAAQLAIADSSRERARQRVLQARERVDALVGTIDDEESQVWLQGLRDRVRDSPSRLEEARDNMLRQAERIHAALKEQLEAVQDLYGPAEQFIKDSEVVRNAGLEFNAELRLLPVWASLANSLDGRRNGEFPDWLIAIPQRLEDTEWASIEPQLVESLQRLERERGESDGEPRHPASALRGSTSLDEFLNSLLNLAWLEVRFGLTGDGLPLSQLSPGQRGLVLALFYLVVDRRTTPLLLDQPEENLDNATIASKLVPAIHEAAGRRQTIVVTHNANLAIVGDADQIVHCQMADEKFSVSSGSIAELDVARFALDVLEGTKPAFDNRRHKYEAFPELAS